MATQEEILNQINKLLQRYARQREDQLFGDARSAASSVGVIMIYGHYAELLGQLSADTLAADPLSESIGQVTLISEDERALLRLPYLKCILANLPKDSDLRKQATKAFLRTPLAAVDRSRSMISSSKISQNWLAKAAAARSKRFEKPLAKHAAAEMQPGMA